MALANSRDWQVIWPNQGPQLTSPVGRRADLRARDHEPSLLHGMPSTHNETVQTILIPRTQQFMVDALTGMIERLGAGDLP
jgi:hypothetical protein